MALRPLFLMSVLLLLVLPRAYGKSFDEYIKAVREKNRAVLSASKNIKGTSLRMNEARLNYMPSFFVNSQYADDERPTTTPSFQGRETIRKTFQSGLSQMFKSGTKATLSFNYAQTTIIGASPSVLPQSNFYDLAPQFEFTQSLWKNWWGEETRATEILLESQVKVQNNSEKFRYKQLILNAEINYWRMAFAQKIVQVQKESLDRSIKIKDWNLARYNKNLADESDYLQSTSALTSRELEYQNALIEEKSAARNFNTLLENEEDFVSYSLSPPSDEELLSLSIPTREGNREDVEVSLAQKNLAIAQASLGQEKNKPTLELYGSYSLNGRATSSGPAMDQALTQDHPFSVIGVRFNTPLNFVNLADNKDGYAQEKMAASLNYERKFYEQEREWNELVNRFKDYKERLKLSQKMVMAGHEKLIKEKARLSKGRSTIFQILQFEQDYANAQLLKLKNESELIGTYAQMKLFSGVSYEE